MNYIKADNRKSIFFVFSFVKLCIWFYKQKFDWVFINNFDVCNDEKIDLVRRFISFIDIAYVEKVKVKFFFNKVKEKDIYSGDRLDILWRRCQSRLMEMQTFEYLNKQ